MLLSAFCHTHVNNSFQFHSPDYIIFVLVKGIALILSMVIFTTSLKASAFAVGLIGATTGAMTTSSCCKISEDSSIKKCDDSKESQEEEGCCEGNSCKCTCCLHLAYLQQLSNNSNHTNDFSDVKFGYSFLYQADYLASVFHPPSLL